MRNDDIGILVVDDRPEICRLATDYLLEQGFRVIAAQNGAEAVRLVEEESPDLVLMDINMPVKDGIQALREIIKRNPAMPVIMMSAQTEIPPAVEAMKLGAKDYLMVPFDPEELLMRVNRVLEETRLKREIGHLRKMLGNAKDLCEVMGYSPQIRAIYDQISTVARTDFTVIIYGESGSGKELVARAVHQNSRRAEGPFLPVDCGSIPENLIESELFGHERGAFTGAYERKKGSFERATGGTLFLDEIGNLPKNMQAKLMRGLQERKIERVGGSGLIDIDIRVIVAGNQRLQDLIAEGKFREDLFHRLNEFMIEIPPLRRRKEDLVYLANRFVDETAAELNKKCPRVSPQALQLLHDYDWPGNVRELRNAIRRAVLLTDSDQILPEHLTVLGMGTRSAAAPLVSLGAFPAMPLRDIVRQFSRDIEQKIISEALDKTGGNKSRAAKMLQIDYKTILTKINAYKLSIPPRSRNQQSP